jgi:hypothetical protein
MPFFSNVFMAFLCPFVSGNKHETSGEESDVYDLHSPFTHRTHLLLWVLYKYLHGAKLHSENNTRNSQNYIEPEGSLPCLRELTTGYFSEID